MRYSFNSKANEADYIKNNSAYKVNIESLENNVEFMWKLSDLIWTNGNVFYLNYEDRHFIMRTELIDSAENTLKSIKKLIDFGHFSDVNVLIRKFRDDLFIYLYFLEVNNRFDDEQISKHEKHCFDWMHGELRGLKLSDILIYLIQNKDLKKVINKYNIRDVWDKIGLNLNDFVHSNGLSFVQMNYCEFSPEKIVEILKDIEFKIDYIISIFVILLILIRPHIISSSDYIDALELGIQPEIGSQYFVAPFIQSFLDENIMKLNPEIKFFIKDSVYMDIE